MEHRDVRGQRLIALFALGTLPCLWMTWRGASTRRVGAGWAGGLGALLFTSALLSPQYAVWIAPAGGIAFNPFAWQFLFVFGIWCGFGNGPKIRGWVTSWPNQALCWTIVVAALVIVIPRSRSRSM
mgnify:CR=1 FL=1